MIKKLKVKFILLAMTALFVLLTVILTGMNCINYNSVVSEADMILSVLSQNKGNFPEPNGELGDRLPPDFSPETPYESRYFSVVLDKSGELVYAETSKIASVDSETAVEYAKRTLKKNKTSGFIGDYRYTVRSEPGGYRITFLDCGRRLTSFYDFLYTSIIMAFAGLVAVFFVIFFLSGRIIRPIAQSYEKQKQFITDAGHEIKTPLTIINANVDILEMELGKNESLADIQQQTQRLSALTNDLVILARMEEAESTMQKIEFPISEVVAQSAHAFRTLALQQGKEFICDIQPMLTLKGNAKSIEQLVSIFMDNAVKYSSAGGRIALQLVKHNRFIYLSAYNTAQTEIKAEQLEHVFDRFYRADSSRNSETGGHGIGLSVAKAIVNAHGGKIRAWTEDGMSFQVSAVFPV